MDVKNDSFWPEMGSGFGEPGGTPHHELPEVHPPDSIVGNYSKHPLIRTRGKNLLGEISRFNTQKYKNLFSHARTNSLIDGYYDKQSNQGV